MNCRSLLGNTVDAVRSFLFCLAVSAVCSCKGLPDAAAWCGLAPEATPDTSTPTPLWNGAAGDVVRQKCTGCHNTSGGLAPFPLETYAQVLEHKSEVRAAVATRAMPPWQAARCCNHYFEDRSLTDGEYETLLRFLDEGAPEGAPTDAGTPPVLSLLSRVDLSLTMPEEYVPNPKAGTDDNRCFVFDWPLSETRFITGMAPRPGMRREVHHVIVAVLHGETLDEAVRLDAADPLPGFDCGGGIGNLRDITVLGGSQQGGDLPRGLGVKVEPGGKLVINVHYSTLSVPTPLPDRTSIDFRLESSARDSAGIPIANPAWFVGDSMEVKAGDPDAVYFYKYRPTLLTGGKPVQLQGITPHMHTFASRITVRILRATGESECLLEIPKWRFGWEQPFWLQDEVTLNPDDEVYLECHFDNSEANQPLGQAPRDFAWGGNGQDMCAAFIAFTK
jgi:hypothetical protein